MPQFTPFISYYKYNSHRMCYNTCTHDLPDIRTRFWALVWYVYNGLITSFSGGTQATTVCSVLLFVVIH